MSEGTTTSTEGTTVDSTGNDENQPIGGSRTFTQDEFNSLLAREKRELRAKYEKFDEYKEKAAQLDALKEAEKTDLEKTQDALAAMQKERDEAIAERDALQAEIDHAAAVQKAATEHKVDAALLARMSGDVDENARFLAEQSANAQKYPNVRDNGEGHSAPLTKAEIASEKDPAKRVQMYASLNAQNRK